MAGHLCRHQDSEMLPQSSLVFNAVPCWGSSERSLEPISRVSGSRRNGASDGCAGLQRSATPSTPAAGFQTVLWPSTHWVPLAPAQPSTSASVLTGPPSQGCGQDSGGWQVMQGPRGSGKDRITVCLMASQALLTLSPWRPLSMAPGGGGVGWGGARMLPVVFGAQSCFQTL